MLIDSTDALRRGHKRRNSFRKATLDLDRFELPQGDDPFARMINDQPAFDRGARPDYGPQAYSGSAEGKKKITILNYIPSYLSRVGFGMGFFPGSGFFIFGLDRKIPKIAKSRGS